MRLSDMSAMSVGKNLVFPQVRESQGEMSVGTLCPTCPNGHSHPAPALTCMFPKVSQRTFRAVPKSQPPAPLEGPGGWESWDWELGKSRCLSDVEAVMKERCCKDCDREPGRWARPAPHPGPRCATHHRAVVKARQIAAHGRAVESGYGITPERYWAMYEAQGGLCAICQRATGTARRLAVDHDHRCAAGHDPKRGCGRCVRGLLCGPCNQMIGRLGEAALTRAVEYLRRGGYARGEEADDG